MFMTHTPTPTRDRALDAATRLAGQIAEALQADLSLRLWDGSVVGRGDPARGDIQLVIAGPQTLRALILRPGLATLFRLFASGALAVEGGSPLEALDRIDHGRLMHLRKRLNLWAVARTALPLLLASGDREANVPDWHDARDGEGQGHDRRRDADFIRFHYDVGNQFYGLFLDPAMIYSSAVFPHEGAGLDEAQQHKLDLICRKLNLRPGQRLLDIGCGWGGLACHAARHYGVEVHGVTLSPAQLAYGQAEVARQGLCDRVTLELVDYRDIDVEGVYDAVSQVEMFEHLGFRNHDAHFARVHRLLKPGGLYFHQASVRRGHGPADRNGAPRPTATTRTITRFIFPGGELDTLGMTTAALGRHGFEVLDVQTLREHFERTLRIWSQRLYDKRERAEALTSAPRTRLWLVYFALFARGFQRGAVNVHQTVARRHRAGASGLPMDRAHLYAESAAPLSTVIK
jgi:cyclopropane-fatty-acyl-phospholipid synthase